MKNKNGQFETSDIALASWLYTCGTQLLFVNRNNPRRCVFVFQHPELELISEWQEGRANGNTGAYYNALQVLKRMVYEHPKK